MADYSLIQNYIYLYHIDKFILLPTYPDSIVDNQPASFSRTSPLARSAPIFSYSNSGPRSMQVTLQLHREMMQEINYAASNINLEIGEDYVDKLVGEIQAIALPKYSSGTKMVNPPMVALRFGNQVYIKGVVDGGVSITYSGPILQDDKYAIVTISFTVSEVDPYDADTVQSVGSFRMINTSLERRLFKR